MCTSRKKGKKKTRAALHKCSMLRIALINAKQLVNKQDDRDFHTLSEYVVILSQKGIFIVRKN